MGNIDSIPVVSQIKSLTQEIGGDPAGALATQQNFAYNNTFPIVSQIASLGYAIEGENGKALNLQKKFAKDMDRVIDSIPVAGHIKGTVHFALGQKERGEEAMKAASHSTGVVVGGIGGFAIGGPAGAVAGGIAGGAGMDGIITESENLINGKNASKPYGYFKIAKNIEDGKIKTVGDGFDAAMVPVFDGVSGLVIGESGGLDASEALGKVGVENSKVAPQIEKVFTGEKPKAPKTVLDLVPSKKKLTLDKPARDNRAKQLNPNHPASGPGRAAGYHGAKTIADKNNHANQLNPNHPAYQKSRIVTLDKPARENLAKQLNPNHPESGPARPTEYHVAKTIADNNRANQLNPNNPAYQKSRMGNPNNANPISNDILESNSISKSNAIPESNSISKSNAIPESNSISKSNAIPESNSISKSNAIPESNAILESNAIPEGNDI